MVQGRALPERSAELDLSLCEAFYQALILDVVLVSFNLFSFFFHQEAKKTASFLMNLSPDRKVSFICFSVTLPYIFHFTFWGPAEQQAFPCQPQILCGSFFLATRSIAYKRNDERVSLASPHLLMFSGLSPVCSLAFTNKYVNQSTKY